MLSGKLLTTIPPQPLNTFHTLLSIENFPSCIAKDCLLNTPTNIFILEDRDLKNVSFIHAEFMSAYDVIISSQIAKHTSPLYWLIPLFPIDLCSFLYLINSYICMHPYIHAHTYFRCGFLGLSILFHWFVSSCTMISEGRQINRKRTEQLTHMWRNTNV